MSVYRIRFSGYAGALCGALQIRVDLRGADVERAAKTVLLDQALGVIAGDELTHGIADLVDGLEDAAMDDLLLQGPEQPLDYAIIRACRWRCCDVLPVLTGIGLW